jgi:hypothetical protein
MDIHKPKPWHGLREFLKEYAIIVVGVLTALAAEQGVEWLHWRLKVEEGRAALRAELAGAAYNSEERVAYRDCFEKRLVYLKRELAAAHGVWAPKPWRLLDNTPYALAVGEAYDSRIRNWSTEVWRGLVADGTAVHFPRAEMLAYARIAHFVDVQGAENSQEWQDLSRVALLGEPLRLSDEAVYQSALGLEDAKRQNRLLALGSVQLAGLIRDAGMTPKSAKWKALMAQLRQDASACSAAAEGD